MLRPLAHLMVAGLLGLRPGQAADAPAAGSAPAKAVRAPATQDKDGNPIRRAVTGHVSNYDEAKVGTYVLPDPLVLGSGERVTDAETWFKRRRPEIQALYEKEIFGRVPPGAPKVTFEVVGTNERAYDGAAVRTHVIGRMGNAPDAPQLNLVLVRPARAERPVPVLLHLVFGAGMVTTAPNANSDATSTPGNTPRVAELGPVEDLLARGYGYATLRYTEIEGDRLDTNLKGVRKLALAPGQMEPAPDEWGTVAAWAWGASRALDYLEHEPAVDATRVGLVGHSRLGKTVLWAGARDTRFAVVFSSCSGEMGAALARRDYGESVDDMALNFPWQFAGSFQKYIGRWNAMPVDAHLVMALIAPRPLFITGGLRDQWADPYGEFLAQVAAGPVYRLLGRKDLGTTERPQLDTPVITGDLGFHYHSGGHTITAADWKAFLEFAGRTLRPGK
jgi:hypothetical protein